MSKTYTAGELAQKTGVSSSSIARYRRSGTITPIESTSRTYLYDTAAVKTLLTIRQSRWTRLQREAGVEPVVSLGRRRFPGLDRAVEDLTGMRFGILVAIRPIRKNGRSCWICKCDCDREKEVMTNNLKRGNTRSCGCLYRYPDRKLAAKHSLYRAYVNGAKTRRLRFKLTEKQFYHMVEKDCTYCGSPPLSVRRTKKSCYKHNGVDRMNNKEGYTEDNVVPCCSLCNIMKKRLTVGEFISQAAKIYEHNKHKTT